VLLCALRRLALQYTQFSKVTHGTRKFLKIGALVRTSLRRITFAIPLPLSALDLTFAYAQLTNAAAG